MLAPLLYLLFFIALWMIPEPKPPRSHRGEDEGTMEALTRAREDVNTEILQLPDPREQPSKGLTMTESVRKLSRPEVRKPFILITTNFFLVTLSGASAIIYYSVDVFQSKGVAGLNKHLASIIVAVILVIGGILGIFLVK